MSVPTLISAPSTVATLGQTYFVDASNSLPGDGSAGSPFRTIAQAAAIALAGDTVIVRAGTYAEQVNVQHSGTQASPITFEAQGQVIISGATSGFKPAQWAGDNDTQNLSGDNWVTLKGFVFSGTSDMAVRASTGWTLDNITVENSAFGVNIRGNDVTVENSLFTDINGPNAHAIVACGGANIRILNNVINGVNTTNQIADLGNSGITKFIETTGLVIAGNISENNHGPGLWLDYGNTNFSITNNTITGNTGVQYGWQAPGLWIEANAAANGIIANNTITNNTGSGIGVLESNGLTIQNNTLSGNALADIEFRNLMRGANLSDYNVQANGNYFGSGDTQIGTFTGDFTGFATPSALNIGFQGDTYAGAVNAVWAGTTYSSLAALQAGTGFETVAATDKLIIAVSEDYYQGDAQYTVRVNGQQIGGVRTATAMHATQQDTTLALSGPFGRDPTVVVNFINDAWGGAAALDRNLYIDGITYDGIAQTAMVEINNNVPRGFALHANSGSAVQTNGILNVVDTLGNTANVAVIKAGSQVVPATTNANLSTTIQESIDSQGVANIVNSKLGKNIATVTVTDLGGASYHFSNFRSVNAELGGAASGSLTVDSAVGGTIRLDSGNYGISLVAAKMRASSGGNTFTVILGGGGNDSLQIDDTVTTGLSTNVIYAGSGFDRMTLIAARSNTVIGDAGTAVVTATSGTNTFTAGTGILDVRGGSGPNAFIFHSSSGLLTIEDFSIAKGDTLTMDAALQGTLSQASDGHGGVMLNCGTTGHGVDLLGLPSLAVSQIHFV